jgi:opacity protein-like surface antigen
MRKTLFVTILVLACAFAAMAQEAPKAQVFGGYQWTSVDFGSGIDRQNFNGWNAALDGYFNKNFGITADFSGAYKSENGADVKIHSYMFGPTLRMPGEKVTPFVHALFGGAHASGSALGMSAASNGFAYAFGGGLDLNAGKNFAIRVGQFDYLGTRFEIESQKNLRDSGGVVFKV